MGALAKQAPSQPDQFGRAQMTDNISSLTGFLDTNRNGSVADDVLGFVGKSSNSKKAVQGSRFRVQVSS
jgi:hypothetical protein